MRTDYELSEATTIVTLPVAQAGISDKRIEFSMFFRRELSYVGQSSNGQYWREYLHLQNIKKQEENIPTVTAAEISKKNMAGVSVLIVPGIFGDCVDEQSLPFGDGITRDRKLSYTAAYQQYMDLGIASIRALQVQGRASSEANGKVVSEEILLEASQHNIEEIIIVAYSKGVPDTLHALARLRAAGQLPQKLKAVVSVAGVVMGTPIADNNAHFYHVLGDLPTLLGCQSSSGGEVQSLTKKVRASWLEQHLPPAGIHYYSVSAYASRENIGPGLIFSYDELNENNSLNDGQVRVADSILPRSTLIATVNSDHWDFVLPLSGHPNFLIRHAASGRSFPREALFRAIIRYVVEDVLH